MRPILVVLLSIGLSACTAGPPVTSLASGPSGTLRFQTRTIPIPGDAFLAGEETGTPADWTPLGPCRAYVQRVRAAGNDIALFEYLDGYHGFDNPQISSRLWRPNVLSAGRCHWVEETPGKLVHRETRQPLSREDPCILLGATVGYNEQAHQKAQKDVQAFLTEVFGLSHVEKR